MNATTFIAWLVITSVSFGAHLTSVVAPIVAQQQDPSERIVVDLASANCCSSLDGCAKFWIGTLCAPVPEMLRRQLKIDDGLVVEEVADQTPASRAGIQPYDVLLTINGTNLLTCDQLVDSIQDARDRPIRLDVLRGGYRFELSVIPAERCVPELHSYVIVADDATKGLHFDDIEKMRLWIEEKKAVDGPMSPFRVLVVGPAESAPAEPSTTDNAFDNSESVLRIPRGDHPVGEPQVIDQQVLQPLVEQLRLNHARIKLMLDHLQLRLDAIDEQLSSIDDGDADRSETERLEIQRAALQQKIERWSNLKQSLGKHLTQIRWSSAGSDAR